MIIAWIGYCLLVSALLGLAAFATERALGHYRKPVRWVWAGALAGSVILPIAAYVAPTLVARFAAAAPLPSGIGTVVSLSDLMTADASGLDWSPVLGGAGVILGALWAVSVIVFGAHVLTTHRRLRREMLGWTPGRILDAPVLMSDDRGPAVVGMGRGVIVMPAWIAELEEDVLRLVFLHEREHQKAGDHRLFALGLFGVTAMPWNPIAWWQLRRLRLAIEYDCDHRVMAHGVGPREYAEALLAVGTRLTSGPLAAVGFAERRPAVERRLRRMTEPLGRMRGPRAAVAVGVGALAVLFACGSPLPTDAPDVSEASAAPDDGFKAVPAFIPYDTPPALRNRAELPQMLDDLYPSDLKAAGVGGRVELWLYVDEDGTVAHHLLKTSSGSPRLDDAAAELVSRMRFSPASNEGETTPVWMSQWVNFGDPPPRSPLAGLPVERLFAIDGELVSREAAEKQMSEAGQADIAAVTILRDREAIDRYGPTASVGVVEITTKSSAGDLPLLTPEQVEALRRAGATGVLKRRPEPGVDESSATGGEPLIVIDGVIRSDLTKEDLGQLDIDVVEVITGPAAVRLYGSPARNGAIQVTTKDGAGKHPPIDRDELELSDTVVQGTVTDEGVVRLPSAPDTDGRPLIVIDGVIQAPSVELSEIDALDIDHVEILKGAAATTMYGSRAANGVIQITTKGG